MNREIQVRGTMATVTLIPQSRPLTAADLESYWVVDPERPAITAWQLIEGGYVEVASVEADQALRVEALFPLALAPSDLVR